MSNLLWKKMKKKKKKEMKTKTKNKKLQDNENGEKQKKQKEKKRKRNLNIVEHSIWKKKKERTNIFLNRQYITTLFWLVVKWNFLGLFEFKGDIRNFFPVHIMKFDENH